MRLQTGSVALRACSALLLGALTGAALLPAGAWAQLPRRIHIIVPFPSGPIDISARVRSEQPLTSRYPCS